MEELRIGVKPRVAENGKQLQRGFCFGNGGLLSAGFFVIFRNLLHHLQQVFKRDPFLLLGSPEFCLAG